MRLFIAIELGRDVIDSIASIQARLSSFGLKMVGRENLHLTLKFLGEVDESQLEHVERMISEGVKEVRGFRLSFHGIGYFGNASHMKVIWAAVKEGSGDFVELAKAIESSLSFIRKEEREPSPHLTIARVRSSGSASDLLREVQSLRDVKVGEVRVKEIILKKSVLTPQGPVYSNVKTFALKP